MTQMRRLIFAVVLFGTMTFTGCTLQKMVKMAKNQETTVTPNPLEVHADTVNVEMAAALPVKMLKKGKVYTVNTFYKYGEQEVALEDVEFKAADYPNNATEQPRKSQDFSFAYDPAMETGKLQVEGVASNPKNGKSKSTPRMDVADGIITTSKLVENAFYAAYAPHGYNNQEELEPTNIDFFFDQGRSALRPSEVRSERGKELTAFIAEKNVTRTVTITGTHSPEGPERINSNLSQDRAQEIEKYYRQQMKKFDYKGMSDSIKFVLKPVVEDWTQFKEMLAEYTGIADDQKSQMVSIVNGSGSFEEKEDQLQALPSYRKVFADVYPKLRTAKTEILTAKEKKSDPEIAALARQISSGQIAADSLTDEELAYAATLSPSLDDKEAIYTAATKKNDSWVSHNNLGSVYLQRAHESSSEADRNSNLEKAITQFEIALNKQDNAQAHSNLAVAYMMQGNKSKAVSEINAAKDVDSDIAGGVAGVRGAIEIMTADYDKAVNTLSNAEETDVNLYNKALAQILKKDFQNAMTTLTELTGRTDSPIVAKAHYLAAIASARLQNESQVVEHLKQAGQADPSLREKALKDLEFRAYASNDSFRDALK